MGTLDFYSQPDEGPPVRVLRLAVIDGVVQVVNGDRAFADALGIFSGVRLLQHGAREMRPEDGEELLSVLAIRFARGSRLWCERVD